MRLVGAEGEHPLVHPDLAQCRVIGVVTRVDASVPLPGVSSLVELVGVENPINVDANVLGCVVVEPEGYQDVGLLVESCP